MIVNNTNIVVKSASSSSDGLDIKIFIIIGVIVSVVILGAIIGLVVYKYI